MPSIKLVESVDSNQASKPVLTETEKQELLDRAIEKRDKLADSRLEMAKMFQEKGKADIALKRLQELVDEFDGSAAATEARKILECM